MAWQGRYLQQTTKQSPHVNSGETLALQLRLAMLILLVILQPVMTSLIDVMGLYHNYQEVVELVLEFYCEMARRTLCYLVASDSRSGH